MDQIKEQKKSRGHAAIDITTIVVGVSMVVYHMISSRFILMSATLHLNTHLLFVLLLVYLNSLRRPGRWWHLTLLFLLLSIVAGSYVYISNKELEFYAGALHRSPDVLIMGATLIFLSLEGLRRAFGLSLPIVILLFILYTFWGHYFPGALGTAYNPPDYVISRLGIGDFTHGGIYGPVLDLSANTIFLFVVFGMLVQTSGAIRFFLQIGRWVGRRMAGGAAMSSVVTSALVGMVTGSVAANIVTTGSFTIPLMKSVGYRSYQAGAIEATASTGGQIMPPVMGVAAFLVALFCGIPYGKLIVYAFIPAILYFLSVGLYVQFQALKMGIRPTAEAVNFKELWLTAPIFVVPLLFLIVVLFMGYPLSLTVSLTIILLVILSYLMPYIGREKPPSLGQWLRGIANGAVMGAEVGASCASIGVLLSCFAITGLAIKLPAFVISLSGGSLPIALLLTMGVSIVLGMGMPTTGAYVLVAVTIAPVLVKMGLTLLQAHLFAFYYACLSFVTPPVAIGAMVAAKLAGTAFWKTGIEATKVAIGSFLVPFLFIWCPILLLQPQEPIWVAPGLVMSFILMVVLQVIVCGYYQTNVNYLERGLLVVVLVLSLMGLAWSNYMMIATSFILFTIITLWQWRKKKLLARGVYTRE